MTNPEIKSNDWLGTANKILAIFLIVAGIHLLIILFFVWFNVWRLTPGVGQADKKEKLQEKNYSDNEEIKIPNQDGKEKLSPAPVKSKDSSTSQPVPSGLP
ncbi:MAG: hypothetical protein WAX69_26515 [Victivallales bacterium]